MKNSRKPFMTSTFVEMCALGLLNQSDAYGYKIAKTIDLQISESTIYPVLRRLEKGGYLESYSQQYNAKLRKIYKITSNGKIHLTELKEKWEQFVICMDSILENGFTGETASKRN